MLLIYGNAEAWQDMYGPEADQLIKAHADVSAELTARGELVSSQGLTTEGAAVVRFRDGALTDDDGRAVQRGQGGLGGLLPDRRGLG